MRKKLTPYEKHYRKCLRNGCSPKLADMLASQQGPAPKTDTRRALGFTTLRGQHGWQTDQLAKAAQKHGYTPSYTDVYNSNAARFFGDPQAFSRPHEIASHYTGLCKRRGWNQLTDDGVVKVKGRESQPTQRTKLAPSLIKAELRKRIKSNPEIAKAPIAEKKKLCRQIVARHGQK